MSRVFRRATALAAMAALVAYGISPLVALAAAVTVSPASGTPGTSITVTGTAFTGNETGIAVTYDGVIVASGRTADASGVWSATFAVPASASGAHIIDAYGSVSTAASVPDIVFTVTPSISLSRTSGAGGTAITISGAGFSGNETGIAVTYDGTVIVSSISATPQGAWTTSTTLPASTAGTHIVDAYGNLTGQTAVPDVTFTVTPGISSSRTSGPPGTSITVTGSSFAASESGITITYDGSPVGGSVAASSSGVWTATVVIPASASGSHIIDASGPTTSAANVPDLTFTVTPVISVNRASGAAGSSTTVTGTGFASSESGITVTYDGTSVGSPVSANAQGGWTATVVLPASTAGSHTIDAYGSMTSASNVPDVVFNITPSIAISQATGAPGSSITITGNSFGASEGGIVVTYDGVPTGSAVTANGQGGWTATLVVPPSAAGPHIVDAYGSITSAGVVPDATFTVSAAATITPAFGNVGGTVQITGSGFSSRVGVRVFFDDKEIPAEGISTTDAFGGFTRSFTVPKSKGGSHTIKVTDGRNESVTSFTLENTAPPAPRPLAPEDGSRVGFLGGTAPTFKWSSVADPSGVTYVLQFDTTTNFAPPILEKADIQGTSYTLAASETLAYGVYYWRIKAIDGALNESTWSQAQLLKSGLMSSTTLMILIVLLLAVGVAAYFLLVRLPARRRAPAMVPEMEMPQTVPGQWRVVDSEQQQIARPKPLPFRLGLPQPSKQSKTISTEDQARLKVIADFAQSVPFAEPGYTADWLLELVESGMGVEATAPIREQILKGEFQVRYEPAWMRHPTYQELTALLQGHPVLGELNAYIDGVNRCGSEAASLLKEIYRDAMGEVPQNFLERGGWTFIAAVYADALSWFLGKSLRDPSDRDYSVRPASEDEGGGPALCGEPSTSFSGTIMQATSDEEAARLKALHLRLRRAYRASERPKLVVGMLAQMDVQRSRLLSVLSQFGRLGSRQ